jgi:hypothetical protein
VPAVPPRPVPSRVRDALAGGDRNLAADRDLAAAITTRFPGVPAAIADARAFTVRAVTWCALQGIAQYVVPDPGPAAGGAVREAAQSVIPSARVAVACPPGDAPALAYALRDAAALPGVTVISGTPVAGPVALLASPALRAVADLDGPACVVLALTLHLMDAGQAAAMIAGVAGQLAAGSAVIVSATVPDATAAGDELIAAFSPAGRVHRHPPGVIAGWLEAAGLEVVPPGVTDVRGWRAGMPEPRLPRPRGVPAATAGGIAVVPG